MILRRSLETDLDFIMAAEHSALASPWVFQWTAEQHRSALADPDCHHTIFAAVPGGAPLGYALVYGLRNPNAAIELRRMVMARPGQGHGRQALRLVMDLALNRMAAHRLWLDLYETNRVALGLYLSEGFSQEGILRDHVRRDGTWHNFIIMSILESEYRQRIQQ